MLANLHINTSNSLGNNLTALVVKKALPVATMGFGSSTQNLNNISMAKADKKHIAIGNKYTTSV